MRDGSHNLRLRQSEGQLVASLQLSAGRRGMRRARIAPLEPDRATHVTVTYRPGLLLAYVDGEPVARNTDLTQGFFHWQPRHLVFGDAQWEGTVEGVAFYSRVLDPSEVAENARRHRAAREARPTRARAVVNARRLESSRAPTLEDIAPYREALAVNSYQVEEVLAGGEMGISAGQTVRIAQWAILDGEALSDGDSGPVTMTLEAYAEQPQLERTVLADTLEIAGPLYYAID